MADGWYPLSGHSGVYYRAVDSSSADQSFHILKQDQVKVYAHVTEEMLSTLTDQPTMNFKAYAIQQEQIATALQAWQQLTSAQET